MKVLKVALVSFLVLAVAGSMQAATIQAGIGASNKDLEVKDKMPVNIQLGEATGKTVTPLHFGANTVFFHAGLARGVSVRQEAFRDALQAAGVHTLRFPGGNPAYYYLPDSRENTMELGHTIGYWAFREDVPHANHFVTLEQLARFAQDAHLQLIYELPCLFYLDGDTPRAIIKSKSRSKKRDWGSLYDRDRIAEGVAYGVGIVKRLRELGAPVAMWELGNEEFAFCDPVDYARVVAAYATAIREIDPLTPIVPVAMGKDWFPAIVPTLQEAGVLGLLQAFQVHYPFGNWPGPGDPENRANPAAFVMGDLKIEKFLDAFRQRCEYLGLGAMPVAVTETTTMRHKNWDPHAVVATQAHALCFAWNWMTLLERRDVNVAVFHEIETPYFGLLRYNVGFDSIQKRFVWLDAAENTTMLAPRFEDQYVVSPTACANRLLSELIDEEIVETNVPKTPALRVLASKRRILIVNRSTDVLQVTVPFLNADAEALVARDLSSCLPGSFGIRELPCQVMQIGTTVTVPAWSVAVVRATVAEPEVEQ